MHARGMRFADDPEPEYVDINSNNVAVVTLQENNHIVLLDLASGSIVNHFSAATVGLDLIDIDTNKFIELNGTITNVPRNNWGQRAIAFTMLTVNYGCLVCFLV